MNAPASAASSAVSSVSSNLFEFTLSKNFEVAVFVSGWVTAAMIVLALLPLVFQLVRSRGLWRSFEIDEAEIGIGDHKIKLSPNETDRQIAYKIWVELSTRKIGLQIDLDHDVIAEVYDSWHTFFGVTRELIKDVPVNKFRRTDTEKIVRMSIEVLNEGLRPHLTKWQARFRRWYERQVAHQDFVENTPQEIQQRFPQFEELAGDLLAVNQKLMIYREKMRALVLS